MNSEDSRAIEGSEDNSDNSPMKRKNVMAYRYKVLLLILSLLSHS